MRQAGQLIGQSIAGQPQAGSPAAVPSGVRQVVVLDEIGDPAPDVRYAAIVFRPTGAPDTYTMELVS